MTLGKQLDIYDETGDPRPVPTAQRPDEVARLVAAWLASYESVDTRRAYARDLRLWCDFCGEVDVHPFDAERVHVDAWARTGAGFKAEPKPASLARRLAAVSAFYGYGVTEEILDCNPVAHVRRPKVDPDETDTRCLTRDEARAMRLIARERAPRRSRIILDLGLLVGLRRNAIRRLDVEDLGYQRGHRTVTYWAKGGRRRTAPLPPELAHMVEEYVGERTEGPLLLTSTGRRLDGSAIYRDVQRMARLAGLVDPDSVTPHSLRHTFITLGLDAGVKLERMQDAAGHADPRQTRRYDHSSRQLEGHPAYVVSGLLS